MDREKVIKGLTRLSTLGVPDCDKGSCPFWRVCVDGEGCYFDMFSFALALLKEQETIQPKTGHWIDTTNTIGFPRCECSECNSEAGAIWMKYCDSFRWTAKGFSHTYTCIHSHQNSPPIQAAT